MPLQRRLPKSGFTNIFAKKWGVVNLRDLTRFESGSVVDEAVLRAAGLIKGQCDGIKVLGSGELTIGVTVVADKFSQSAIVKIEAAGGKAEVKGG
jgi:large subunit ribosomal protein L15